MLCIYALYSKKCKTGKNHLENSKTWLVCGISKHIHIELKEGVGHNLSYKTYIELFLCMNSFWFIWVLYLLRLDILIAKDLKGLKGKNV